MSSGKEFAWRVHDNLSSWTARVDVKASIALAIEAAVLGFALVLAEDGRVLDNIENCTRWVLYLGLASIFASVVLSILVVLPQLRAKHTKSEYKQNRIYFGHLRHWEDDDLAKSLKEEEHEIDQLARQLVNTSKIIWRKHVWLQWSLYAFLAGVLLLGLVIVLVLVGVTKP